MVMTSRMIIAVVLILALLQNGGVESCKAFLNLAPMGFIIDLAQSPSPLFAAQRTLVLSGLGPVISLPPPLFSRLPGGEWLARDPHPTRAVM